MEQPTASQEMMQSMLSSAAILENYNGAPPTPDPSASPAPPPSGFYKIADEEMPEILKFLEGNKEFDFKEWAVVGQADTQQAPEASAPPQQFLAESLKSDKEEDEAGLSNSMFLRNFEEELRLAREERAKAWAAAPQHHQVASVQAEGVSSHENQLGGGGIRPNEPFTVVVPHETFVSFKSVGGQSDSKDETDGLKGSGKEAIDESWVWVEKPVPSNPVSLITCVHHPPKAEETQPFFGNWPSFGVYNKLAAVGAATVGAFTFGFVMGAQAAL